MRFVTKGRSGTLELYLARRPSGAGAAVVYDPAGGVLQASPTVALDAVNTTLASAVQAGAQSVSLTSASDVVVGRRYQLGGAEESGGESVVVAGLAGTTATLARKLRRAQASGATFQGARLTLAITTASTAEAQRGCRAEWTNPTSGVDEVIPVPFDVVLWTPTTQLTTPDLYDLDPLFSKRIPEGAWLPGTIAKAWERLTDDLAAKDKVPGSYAGVIELTRAHGYLVLALLAEGDELDDEAQARLETMQARYKQELAATLARLPYSEASDGITRPGVAYYRGVSLIRS